MPVVIDASDSAQFNVSGYTATISPSSTLDDRGNKTWAVKMDLGVVKDSSNVLHLGLDGSEYHFTLLDSTDPSVTTYSPARNATDAVTNQSIILTFTEDIQIGTGTIVLTPTGGNLLNTPVSINIADTSQVCGCVQMLHECHGGSIDRQHS